MATLHELLAPVVVHSMVTQVTAPKNRLASFFKMGIGQSNRQAGRGKYTAWDVFDRTRKTARIRANDAGPGTRKRQKIGNVQAQLARSHEMIELLWDELDVIRMLGSNNAEIGSGGEGYIKRQVGHLADLYSNFTEALVAGMCRGSLQFVVSGDDWYPVFSGGDVTIDYQIPAGNKDQLDMLGGGDIIGTAWDNAAAPIIGDCLAVNAAFEQLHGYPLKHIWVTSVVWGFVIANTEVKALAGSANTPFTMWRREDPPGPDGTPATEYVARLAGLPDVLWHIYDGGLELGTSDTFTKVIGDTAALFLPDPSSQICTMREGTETLVEDYGSAPMKVTGFHTWKRNEIKPSRIELLALTNELPELYIPKSIAYATVDF